METGSQHLRKAAEIVRLPELPEIDERILSRLKPPYDLIAEWLQYTSWESMATRKFLAIYASNEKPDGRHVAWPEGPTPDGGYAYLRFVVPTELFERTVRHFRSTFDARLDEEGRFPWYMWVIGRTPISYEDVCAEIIRAASS